ncbi:ATP-dependent DNA helicase DinG [Ferrimonas balearica]|uniref:ATP-dependent DNA helicase DinG n=1 Tax=Ferrimonas balearica TaxID=44012 RepID=UPI001C959D3A|nr:ATP-dependent DNA helicase DinG [Ferrimonas balearica]MBY6094715.1 ATP-dependent DNA helicase DinG [Ferrimonas balearica]MBY6225190.1 ATP-dependent DNA helicase DinG [Ferrimonas balearica]
MLSDKVKKSTRTAYNNLADAIPNFVRRKEQNYLVAEIAKTLAGAYQKDRRIIVVQAGTGTGKSLAYALGALPLALAQGKKLCISTATVALQEQLVNKDLPLLQRHSGLQFRFGLAKGRQRYVCLSKLELLAGEVPDNQGALWETKPADGDVALLKRLHQAYHDGKWDGEVDSVPEPVPDHLWSQIASDKHSCNRQLAAHRDCPFHKSREKMDSWDVLIINHSLLLADLELGGGKILPDPDSMYYVLDEAHHLPQVARDFSAASATVKGSIDALGKLEKLAHKLARELASDKAAITASELSEDVDSLTEQMGQLQAFCDNNPFLFDNADRRHRFAGGVLPPVLVTLVESLGGASRGALKRLGKLQQMLMEAIKDGEIKGHKAEPLVADLGFAMQRLENQDNLWQMLAKPVPEKSAPQARWIDKLDGNRDDYLVSASPIEIGFMLEEMLWSKAAGVALLSATLMALGNFDHYRHQVGLRADDGTRYLNLPSPFNYQDNATLFLPKVEVEPNDDRFSDVLNTMIPALLEEESASLVLFTSYRQMESVAESLRRFKRLPVLVQGESPRQELIREHKARIDAGKPSILFGTGSFSEGLDLPGDYLTNLIITRVPFAVPTSPVDQAHAEYIKAKGGNPFLQLAVPDAAKKLVQACGRLLRNEQDYGRITILDRRLVSKQYGTALLNSLPPYRRHIEY